MQQRKGYYFAIHEHFSSYSFHAAVKLLHLRNYHPYVNVLQAWLNAAPTLDSL